MSVGENREMFISSIAKVKQFVANSNRIFTIHKSKESAVNI